MAERHLNLLDWGTALVCEFGESAAHVVGRERRAELFAVGLTGGKLR
jgi:hypothetical protein